MPLKTWIITCTLLAVGLMVTSIWTWQQAAHFSLSAERPDVVLWAWRTAAIAAAALAQVVILVLVVGNIYRTRRLDKILRIAAASVFMIALISAVALTLAGR